jgi:hypothetical protein
MQRVALLGVVALAGSLLVAPVQAGKGAFLPTYHAPPCSGGDCRGDDPRSGLPCSGLLCTFSSAQSLQRPVTAAEAAEAEKARAAAEAAAAAQTPPQPPAAAPAKPKRSTRKVAKKPLAAPVAVSSPNAKP